ncbi:adenylosuccinate lyase [Candidatus Gottesmanbacteria bacterium RIFCSPLOWO2_12_FULL_42_10]|nr:MAG: adenylosuccinate lyase [Candidatus Gottesmanbacteria bacterium RIFCSPLOWO2_12_FULL_42_10]
MTDEIHRLLAVCLLDGRNSDKLPVLKDYFSEYALIRYRLRVETEYLLFLNRQTNLFNKLTLNEENKIKLICRSFTPLEALKVKETEKIINHDVKAVEYYLADSLKKRGLSRIVPFVHFGLTSYDINIPAYGLILKDFKTEVMPGYLNKITAILKELIVKTQNSVMLARTHGQPALPTTMGKELAVFYQRLTKEMKIMEKTKIEGKLSGAVGNFNALAFVCPEYDWLKLSRKFIGSLGLLPNVVTTQILPYDNWLIFFDSLRHLNSILINFCQDIWWYISLEYFRQKKIEAEVGSSTMAHKINPITFENTEGNLLLANALFEFFARKLPVSRLQRDLTDSTVKRDFGLAFGFSLLAWDSLLSGLKRITADPLKMAADLDSHWEIYAEGVQTYLRKKGQDQAFEQLKKETRGKNLNRQEFLRILESLPLEKSDRERLKIKSLADYQGLTANIIKEAFKSAKAKK